MKEKGFYLLKSPFREHFECLLDTISFLSDCQVWLTFGKTERIKSGKFFAIPLYKYKVINKEDGYYLKAKVKMENGKVLTKEFGPVPNGIAENFFIPLCSYEDQKDKKEKLIVLLTKRTEKKWVVPLMFEQLKEIYLKKADAVNSKDSDEASRLFELGIKFLEKILQNVKEQRGFDWVTIYHVDDIVENE